MVARAGCLGLVRQLRLRCRSLIWRLALRVRCLRHRRNVLGQGSPKSGDSSESDYMCTQIPLRKEVKEEPRMVDARLFWLLKQLESGG